MLGTKCLCQSLVGICAIHIQRTHTDHLHHARYLKCKKPSFLEVIEQYLVEVRAKYNREKAGELFEKLTDGTVSNQKPDGEEIFIYRR